MKKLLILAFVLLLLLSGCGEAPEETVPTTEPVATEDPGVYLPGSEAESSSGGAVYQYAPEGEDFLDIGILGDRVFLFSGKEKTTIQVLTGEAGQRGPKRELPLAPESYTIVNSGIAYYDGNGAVVYLDGQLEQHHTLTLPEGSAGLPAIAPEGSEVFYCQGQALRGLDTQREVSRLIKSQSCTDQVLEACFFEGKLVRSLVTLEDGTKELRYISTENGATVSTDTGIERLDTHGDSYFLTRMDGVTRQYIYGARTETPKLLHAPETCMVGALPLGGAVGIKTEETGLTLSFYDLESGKKTAAVTIPGGKPVVDLCADSRTGCIWVLTEEGGLYRWQKEKSPVTEDAVYSGTVFTREAPDTEGLAALQTRVDALNKQHGVSIRIWKEAVKTTDGHVLEEEYQTAAITQALDAVEAVLVKFPENFLYKSVNTKLRLCIVRSVDGEVKSLRFLDDRDTYILLCCGMDMETAFLKAMGYVVDIHTLGNSPMLDNWSKLNPEGFAYGEQADDSLTKGESRAFADAESMTALAEERARLFYYAMTPENGEMFQSEIMQQKLRLMCQAIRDAWRLEKKTETYLWEQYLTESIAYKK
ncbi:MAG: hypothetical protein IKU07_10315 [Oscillospiraceae bacterium]|nr:hypothetical protein [Oscillospiraceae bacterium]